MPRRAAAAGCGRRAGRPNQPRRLSASPSPSRPDPPPRDTELASSTPSQPSSIASAASEAVPIPASRITGTPARSAMMPHVVGVADPHAGADRRAERHHRGAARLLEPPREDRIVVRVGQDREAVVDQGLGRLDQLDRIREEGAVVADHLELHPVGLERLPGELRRPDRVPGRVAAGRVGEREQAEATDQVQHRPLRLGIDPPERHRDDLGARGDQGLLHLLERAEAAGADDQARAPAPAAELEAVLGAALDRRQDLDLLPLARARSSPTRCAGPPRRRGRRRRRAARRRPRGLDRGDDGGPVRQRDRLAVELDVHRDLHRPSPPGCPANRWGENGVRSTGGSSPASRARRCSRP